MLSEKALDKKKVFVFFLLGLAVFFLYLYFFVDVNQMITIMKRADPVYLTTAFIAVNFSVFFFAYTWKILLEILSVRVSMSQSLLLVWVSTFIDLLIPAEALSGEVSRAYMLSKSSSANIGSIAASIVSHRILTMTMTLGGLIAGSITFLIGHKVHIYIVEFVIAITILSVISIGGLYILGIKESITKRVVNALFRVVDFVTRGRMDLDHYRKVAETSLKHFHEGFKTLTRSPQGLIRSIFASFLAWLFDLVLILFVFIAIGFPTSFSIVLIVYSFIGALQTMPVGLPGVIGIAEIVMTTLYALLGIPVTVAATATVLTRVVSFWYRLFVGYIAFQFSGIKYFTKKN